MINGASAKKLNHLSKVSNLQPRQLPVAVFTTALTDCFVLYMGSICLRYAA